MANIILHLDKGNTITLTNDTNHEKLLKDYENTLITKVEITLDDVNETIYETYSLDEDTLEVFDNLLYYDTNQLPPTEVGGLFLSSVVKRLKADSLPKDSVLRPYTFYTVT